MVRMTVIAAVASTALAVTKQSVTATVSRVIEKTLLISKPHPHQFVIRKQPNSNNILMIWLIIIANIINISTSQSPTSSTTTASTGNIDQYVIPSLIQPYQPFNFRPQPNRNQQLQQHNQNERQSPQSSQEPNNIFRQINSFIQSRQRNATEIAGNVIFKYYNA